LRALSLFSGIGGIDLACEWAGIETAAFCEKDAYCRRVLAKHWPSVPVFEDIHHLNEKQIEALGPIDIVTGGFPCQPVSCAGKRRGQADERWLWPEMLRIIELARPDWVVAENVPGLRTLGADRVLTDLERAGYASWPLVVGAVHAGAPHRRQRVFVVANADGQAIRDPKQWLAPRRAAGGVRNEGIAVARHDGAIRAVADADSKRRDGRSRVLQATGPGGRFPIEGGAWNIEPDVGRVAHGIPARVDRLRALGNAVVPQQIYPIFAAIQEAGMTALAEAA
jgi:DNA (cytosine-5)-methyltransferase 1